MSLPYGLLGLLIYQDSTGYDLTKFFEESLNNFWHAQSSQIYRELDRMEKKGWVTSQNIIQEKRPNKRVYTITDEGHSEMQAWLDSGNLELRNVHDPLLVRVFFGASAPEVTLALLKACREMALVYAEKLQKSGLTSIDHYADTLPGGDHHCLYWEMTLEYGVSTALARAEWAQRCIDKLESETKT